MEIQKPTPENDTSSTLPLDRIQDRQTNTRKLQQRHVTALAESIAVLGLLEPIVVDRGGKLLAGKHRLAAINWLKHSNPTAYTQHFPNDRVPVKMMEFDAQMETEWALAIEIAENELRRGYTPAEVRELASRLREAGYVDLKGRPAKGQKALRPALGVILGKNLSTIRRYLNQDEDKKSRSPERLSDDRKDLRKAKNLLTRWANKTASELHTTAERQLAKELPRLMELIDAVIHELNSLE
jgi:ParB family chromosome partitioning protein